MDALPLQERTGADYASTVIAQDQGGDHVPVMHACGHDIHVACLLGASRLLADHQDQWRGTLLALFQPAEEASDGARGMLADALLDRIPAPDVALPQHVLPDVAGHVSTLSGPVQQDDPIRSPGWANCAHPPYPLQGQPNTSEMAETYAIRRAPPASGVKRRWLSFQPVAAMDTSGKFCDNQRKRFCLPFGLISEVLRHR
ncbi:M20/M25/M40 family metallo-hydrolase [Arthrobacter sp. YAF17]|uniref:M20/M25/M40 family metallo-hydrolase n=1 Tax=Arthrobacter sp. YAF17 TaxID=3233077 RepID=UPI003F929E41